MHGGLLLWGASWHWHGPWFAWWSWALWLMLLLILGGVAIYLVRRNRKPRVPERASSSAEQLLAERFARDELTEEEYRARLSVLRETGGER